MFTFISLFHDMDIKMLYKKKNGIIQVTLTSHSIGSIWRG